MFYIFADESCQNKHRFMVLGGVCAKANDVPVILSRIAQVRSKHGITAEFKWTKVSKAKLPAYIDLVDVFIELSQQDLIHFHSLTVDTNKLNHSKFNAGDSEIGFNKMIYQLLIKFGRLYSNHQPYHCFLDKRNTKHSLDELKDILNNGISNRWGHAYRPYRRVVFLDSKKHDLLQLNDILLGGLAARTNEHHLIANASQHKSYLSEYILTHTNITNPLTSTPRGIFRFTTWIFLLSR